MNWIGTTAEGPALDKQEFRRKYLLRLASNPATLLPTVGGASALLLAWALSLPVVVGFAGVASVFGGLGVLLTRLLVVDDTAAKEAFEEMERESAQARQQALDALELRLAADADPRDERMLRDLRELASIFRDAETWPKSVTASSAVEISSGVEKLFTTCVQSLEQQVSLAELLRRVSTPAAREPIVVERERILADVSTSIEQLSHILARVQGLRAAGVGGTSELGRIREDLDQSLIVAGRVAERMRDWREQHREAE